MSNISPSEQFLREFFAGFTAEVMAEPDAVESIVDRYYTADIEQIVDGVRMDRARLVQHVRPVQRNLRRYRYDVHEVWRYDEKLAARFAVHAELRSGRVMSTEVQLMAEFAPDGRMRRAHQMTRALEPLAEL